MSQKGKKLLIIFDIDETLIQYISTNDFHLFEKNQASIDPNMYKIRTINNNKSCVLFRPHVNDLFEMVKRDNFYKVALWTYSERSYANEMANILTEKYNLPADFFLFKFGAEDMDEENMDDNGDDSVHSGPKDLYEIYRRFPDFNMFNTILIDDRYGNINHSHNINNGLLIQPFAPFGAEKKRVELIPERLHDDVFANLIYIFDKFRRDILGCSPQDIEYSFNTEPILQPKRLKRMQLENLYKYFAVKIQKIPFLGEFPYQTKSMIYIKDINQANYEIMPSRGGKKNKKVNKSRRNKTRRNKTVKK